MSAARILVFTGDGKGKTTAALGMALRAVGHEMRVGIVQFIKNDATVGEVAALSHLPGVKLVQCGKGFVPRGEGAKIEPHRSAAGRGLKQAGKMIASGKFDVVILDEVCNAIARELVEEEDVIRAVQRAGEGMCIVLTGRHATPGLVGLADTVTEMRCLKHGYLAGIPAQKGVER